MTARTVYFHLKTRVVRPGESFPEYVVETLITNLGRRTVC